MSYMLKFVNVTGFEPAQFKYPSNSFLTQSALNQPDIPILVHVLCFAGVGGIEPPTLRLKIICSNLLS